MSVWVWVVAMRGEWQWVCEYPKGAGHQKSATVYVCIRLYDNMYML